MDKSPPRELRRAMGSRFGVDDPKAWLEEFLRCQPSYIDAAKALDVTTTTLYRWRRDLGVASPW